MIQQYVSNLHVYFTICRKLMDNMLTKLLNEMKNFTLKSSYLFIINYLFIILFKIGRSSSRPRHENKSFGKEGIHD